MNYCSHSSTPPTCAMMAKWIRRPRSTRPPPPSTRREGNAGFAYISEVTPSGHCQHKETPRPHSLTPTECGQRVLLCAQRVDGVTWRLKVQRAQRMQRQPPMAVFSCFSWSSSSGPWAATVEAHAPMMDEHSQHSLEPQGRRCATPLEGGCLSAKRKPKVSCFVALLLPLQPA